MTMTGLQATHLTGVWGGRILFSNLSLTLNPGETIQIVGPNGCGKTSLLRILAGLLAPQKGQIRWRGCLINECGAEYRQMFGYVGHKNAVKAGLTVLENLQLYSCLQQNHSPPNLPALLQRLTLWTLRQRRSETLSAGQRQRLALARLTLTNAPLWILDEPFTALDAEGIQEWLNIMTYHISQGGMIILTSHQSLTGWSAVFKQITLS